MYNVSHRSVTKQISVHISLQIFARSTGVRGEAASGKGRCRVLVRSERSLGYRSLTYDICRWLWKAVFEKTRGS